MDRHGNGRLQPTKGDPVYAHHLQWCWFVVATFARPLGEIVNHRRAFEPEIGDVVAEKKGRATACVAALDVALSDRTYLLGDTLSGVDLSFNYVMRSYRRMVSEALPANFQTYVDRVTALPSYEATVKADVETGERLNG